MSRRLRRYELLLSRSVDECGYAVGVCQLVEPRSTFACMAQLPVISGKQAVTALEHAGFTVSRQKGSHVSLVHPGPPRRLIVVPLHKELDRGTLRAIIRQADLTVEQFCELLYG